MRYNLKHIQRTILTNFVQVYIKLRYKNTIIFLKNKKNKKLIINIHYLPVKE